MVKRPKVRRFFEDRDFPVSVFGPVEWGGVYFVGRVLSV